jgi:hypothetical protein
MYSGMAVRNAKAAITAKLCFKSKHPADEKIIERNIPRVRAQTIAGIGVSSHPSPETPKIPTQRFGIPAKVTKMLGTGASSEAGVPRLPATTPDPVSTEK